MCTGALGTVRRAEVCVQSVAWAGPPRADQPEGTMTEQPRKPDLTETSPMDSKARADAERTAKAELESDHSSNGQGHSGGAGGHAKSKTKGGTNIDTI